MDDNKGFNAYKKYLAVRQHFTSNYDFFKYKGQVKCNSVSFSKRKDRFLFAKAQNKFTEQDLTLFYVASFINNTKSFPRSIFSAQGEKLFQEMKKRHQSLSYTAENELSSSNNHSINDILAINSPKVIDMLYSKEISLETVVFIDQATGFVGLFDKYSCSHPLWEDLSFLLRKYRPFVPNNVATAKKTLHKIYTE